MVASSRVRLGGRGWVVDPVGGDALGEDVDGGLLACRDDERFVDLPASGHGT